MNLKPSLKTLVIICSLGAFFLWGVILNTDISWIYNLRFLIGLLYFAGNLTLFTIGEKYPRFTIATRYLIIGVLNTLVDLGFLSFLLYFNQNKTTGWYYILFKSLSFILALGNSYYFNSHFSFSNFQQKSSHIERVSKFLLVSLIALAININLASLINHFNFWSLSPHFWGTLAALIASFFGTIFNFIGYRFWVFNN